MERPFSANRTLCAISGRLGKWLAIGVDSVAKAFGADEKQTEKARMVFGQGAAFLVTAAGAPEAAAAILSSASVMPSQPIDLGEIATKPANQKKEEEEEKA